MANSFLYQNGLSALLSGGDFETDTIRLMLLLKAYEPNRDHDFVSTIEGDEATGGTYSRLTLANATVAVDDANDRVTVDGDDVTFSSPDVDQDIIGVVGYRQVGGDDSTPGDDEPVFFVSRGGDDITGVDTTNDVFTLASDQSANISAGDRLQVHGSSGNDGLYTVASVSGTDVTVNESVPDGTADGTVYALRQTDGNNIDVTFDSLSIGLINT